MHCPLFRSYFGQIYTLYNQAIEKGKTESEAISKVSNIFFNAYKPCPVVV